MVHTVRDNIYTCIYTMDDTHMYTYVQSLGMLKALMWNEDIVKET